MKIYFAGWEAGRGLLHELILKKVTNVLTSYFYNKKLNHYKEWFLEGKKIFLDSGAFSAWSQKTPISLHEYISFVRKVSEYLICYANLDSITSAKESLDNYNIMKSEGLNPIPCFHYNEKFSILENYCKDCDYVAVGGMVGINQAKKRDWLDTIFSVFPKQKFHGFGLTALPLLGRYPWYSVDSTSWKRGSHLGQVMLPDGRILNFSRKNNNKDNNFMNSILKNKYPKLDINKIYDDYKYRDGITVLSTLQIEKRLTKNPPIFKEKQTKLF